MISILRGSFDIILPCGLDAAGRCKLPPQMSGDMEKLEKMLGCRVAGANLKDLLAGEDTFPSWHKFFWFQKAFHWMFRILPSPISWAWIHFKIRKTSQTSLPTFETWFAKPIVLKEAKCLCLLKAFGHALLDLCHQLHRSCTATRLQSRYWDVEYAAVRHLSDTFLALFTVAARRKPPAPSVMDSGSLICWRMFGHIERFFSTYWALFSSVWGYLGPIWGYVGPIWGYVGPMWAYLRLMLGLCWAYLDPFLAYIGPDQEFWPLLKNIQKHRILEQKWAPPS